jgi:hypothetical protein
MLRAEPSQSLETTTHGVAAPSVDWRARRRWGIGEDSVVLFAGAQVPAL